MPIGKRRAAKKRPAKSVEPPPTAGRRGVREGDIYRHRSEKEFYCVVEVISDAVNYVTEKGVAPVQILNTTYTDLLSLKKNMSLSNMKALIAEGKWILVENINKLWK